MDDEDLTGISIWPRVALGAVGVILTAAGTVATFLPGTNVAGVPLLIVAGATFLYVAASGQQLIHVNRDGVEFGRVKRLERVLQEVVTDPQIPDAAKDRIVDVAEENGIALADLSPQDFETEAFRLMNELSRGNGFTVERAARGDGPDFILRRKRGGDSVPVEVKRIVRPRSLDSAVNQVMNFGRSQGILIVADRKSGPPVRDRGEQTVWILSLDRSDSMRSEWLDALRAMELL